MCAASLTWDDNNSGAAEEDGFKVYRSNAPIDLTALPAPIATLPANTTAYEDPAPILGDNYYVVSTYKAGSIRFLVFDMKTIGAGGVVVSQKWRVFISSVGSNGDAAIAEIEMRDSLGGADLCSGGTPSASSQFSGSFSSAKAFDNSTGSIWAATAGDVGSSGAWVEYQFPTAVSIVQIAITARSGSFSDQAPKDFDLEYWDGAAWVSVLSVTGGAVWSSLEQRVYDV